MECTATLSAVCREGGEIAWSARRPCQLSVGREARYCGACLHSVRVCVSVSVCVCVRRDSVECTATLSAVCREGGEIAWSARRPCQLSVGREARYCGAHVWEARYCVDLVSCL